MSCAITHKNKSVPFFALQAVEALNISVQNAKGCINS